MRQWNIQIIICLAKRCRTSVAVLLAGCIMLAGSMVWAKSDEPKIVQTVAVMNFENLKPPDLDYLGAAIAESLSSRLAGTDMCRVVERRRLDLLLQEQDFWLSALVDSNTAGEVGRILGARWLVIGSYCVQFFPERRTITLKVIETAEGVARWGNEFKSKTQDEVEQAAYLGLVKWLSLRAQKQIVPAPSKAIQEEEDVRRKGLSLLREGKASEAFPFLWKAVEQHPEDVALHRTLSGCAAEANRTADLVSKYRELVKAHPDSAVVHNYLGNAYLMIDGRDVGGNAEDAYKKSLKLDKNFAPPLANLAMIQFNRGNFKSAVKGFEKYVSKAKSDAPGWCNLGNARLERLRQSGKRNTRNEAEVEDAYQKVIALELTLPGPFIGLGALREWQGRYTDALEAYSAAIQLAPGREDLQAQIDSLKKKIPMSSTPAPSLVMKLRGKESQEAFDAAAVAVLYQAALELKAEGKVQAAAELLQEALRRDENNATGWRLLERTYREAGNDEQANQASERAKALRPENLRHPEK